MSEMDLSRLETEQRNPETMDIDSVSTVEIIEKINNEDNKVAAIVRGQRHAIAALVDACAPRLIAGGRLIYIGAGTSGRLGILDATECLPTFGVSPELIQGVMAGGVEAIFKAKEGAEDSVELAVADLKALNLNERDTVVGLAASGRTPYVIGGLDYARHQGALTGSICCVSHAEVSAHADYPIEVVTGAEAITGSTRMKAGTAQKMVLNMLSTACMIKYGKVFSNLMVDVQPTNEKLVIRAKRIIQESIDHPVDAGALLEASGKDVKVAIIMGVAGLSRDEAILQLQRYNGHVRNTINHLSEKR